VQTKNTHTPFTHLQGFDIGRRLFRHSVQLCPRFCSKKDRNRLNALIRWIDWPAVGLNACILSGEK